MRRQSGVTLVELLVVILIVAILAVTMLPMFKKYVVQAQYAAEPIPLVGHIRTQIGLYQYEHNTIPWNEPTYGVLTFKKESKKFAAQVYAFADVRSDKAATAVTPYQKMEISLNELSGKRVDPTQVHYAVVATNACYGYAIGIFGNGGDGLPQNTGYAVTECYFPGVTVSDKVGTSADSKIEKGYKFVATWKNYTGDGAKDGNTQFFFSHAGAGVATDGSKDLGICLIPNADGFSSATTLDNLFGSGKMTSQINGACGSWEYSDPTK